MLFASLLFLVSVTRALPEFALICGGQVILDPEVESCCNGVAFPFRTQYCCNNVVSDLPCAVDGSLTFDGPALIFHANPVDGDLADDLDDDDEDDEDEEFESTSLADDEDDDDSVDNTESPEFSDESVDEDDDSGEGIEDDDEDDDGDEAGSEDEDDDNEESAGETDDDAEAETNDDGADGQFAGVFDPQNGGDPSLNSQGSSSSSDMEYYVKITLINMWLILGLILVVNIIFYWCYCRQNNQANKLNRVKSNNMFVEDPSISQRSEEEDAEMV